MECSDDRWNTNILIHVRCRFTLLITIPTRSILQAPIRLLECRTMKERCMKWGDGWDAILSLIGKDQLVVSEDSIATLRESEVEWWLKWVWLSEWLVACAFVKLSLFLSYWIKEAIDEENDDRLWSIEINLRLVYKRRLLLIPSCIMKSTFSDIFTWLLAVKWSTSNKEQQPHHILILLGLGVHNCLFGLSTQPANRIVTHCRIHPHRMRHLYFAFPYFLTSRCCTLAHFIVSIQVNSDRSHERGENMASVPTRVHTMNLAMLASNCFLFAFICLFGVALTPSSIKFCFSIFYATRCITWHPYHWVLEMKLFLLDWDGRTTLPSHSLATCTCLKERQNQATMNWRIFMTHNSDHLA